MPPSPRPPVHDHLSNRLRPHKRHPAAADVPAQRVDPSPAHDPPQRGGAYGPRNSRILGPSAPDLILSPTLPPPSTHLSAQQLHAPHSPTNQYSSIQRYRLSPGSAWQDSLPPGGTHRPHYMSHPPARPLIKSASDQSCHPTPPDLVPPPAQYLQSQRSSVPSLSAGSAGSSAGNRHLVAHGSASVRKVSIPPVRNLVDAASGFRPPLSPGATWSEHSPFQTPTTASRVHWSGTAGLSTGLSLSREDYLSPRDNTFRLSGGPQIWKGLEPWSSSHASPEPDSAQDQATATAPLNPSPGTAETSTSFDDHNRSISSHDSPSDATRPSGARPSFPVIPATKPLPQSRKRQFKYLTGASRPRLQGNKSNANHLVTQSRKKVKRACLFCKRSHMPCDVSRPCHRCVKRGIGHLCNDGPSTEATVAPAHTTSDSLDTSAVAISEFTDLEKDEPNYGLIFGDKTLDRTQHLPEGSIHQPGVSLPYLGVPGLHQDSQRAGSVRSMYHEWFSSSREPVIPLVVPVSLVTGAAAVGPESFGPASEQWERALAASQDAIHVVEMLAGQKRALVELTINRQLSYGSDISEEEHLAIRRFLRDQAPLWHLLQYPHSIVCEEGLTLVALNASQDRLDRWGYGHFSIWLQKMFDTDRQRSIDRTLGLIRLRYLRLALSSTEQQVQALERSYQSSFHHYCTNVLESVPHGVVLVSRTGFILAGNRRMTHWLQLSPHEIFSGSIPYFELVSCRDALSVMETYAFAADVLAPHKAPQNASDVDSIPLPEQKHATVFHDFVVDRQRLTWGNRSRDQSNTTSHGAAGQTLGDNTSKVVRFHGQVTIQLVADEYGTGIPPFLVLYVLKA